MGWESVGGRESRAVVSMATTVRVTDRAPTEGLSLGSKGKGIELGV